MFILTESNGHNNWSINVLNIDVEERIEKFRCNF